MDSIPDFRRTKHGYSLIEIMFSLVLITGGLVGAAGLILQAGRTEQHARHRLSASTIAQDVLGQMETAEFEDISLTTEAFSVATITQRCETARLPSPVVTVEIGPYPKPATAYLKRVVITIDWGNADAGPISRGHLEMESLFADDLTTIWNG